MKIVIARPSGAIGSQHGPQLVAGGHEVVGTTHSAAKAEPKPPSEAGAGVAALRHREDGVTR